MNTIAEPKLDQTVYEIEPENLLTPALAIYPAIVRHNIQRTVALLGGDAARWRPHLKTVKLASMMRLLVDAKVTAAKCATTRELLVACESGFEDVLVAYAHTGANATRVAEIASKYPKIRVSAVVEAPEQIANWIDTPVSLFVDLNSGMNRTGIDATSAGQVVSLARQIEAAGLPLRGLHFYDGHANEPDLDQRTTLAHERYRQLLTLVDSLEAQGVPVGEVITTGTPALPSALSFPGFSNAPFLHRVSPGTVVYNDSMTLKQLPEEYGYQPAVAVITRVVSHPKPGVITCDAGHKSLSVDSGVPNCVILGEPEFRPLKPSEEHLPIEVPAGKRLPPLGSTLILIPRHVCPTVNNFEFAAMIEDGEVMSVDAVTARGREGPLFHR